MAARRLSRSIRSATRNDADQDDADKHDAYMGKVIKRSVTLNGHRTSYSIEDEFQVQLQRLAEMRGQPLAALIADIDAAPRTDGGLSSALRLHVLQSILQDRKTATE
jgi:predicted DNA-binding ribbon-helix-helix protein